MCKNPEKIPDAIIPIYIIVFFLAGNTIYNNKDAGIAFFESYNGKIYDNTVTDCKFGIRLSLGAGDNKIYDNTFSDLTQYGLYTYKGTDEENDDRSKDNKGRPFNNEFENNVIKNVDVGVQVKESDDIAFRSECQTAGDTIVSSIYEICNLTFRQFLIKGCLCSSTTLLYSSYFRRQLLLFYRQQVHPFEERATKAKVA